MFPASRYPQINSLSSMRVYHGLMIIWGIWALAAAYTRGLADGVAMAGMSLTWSWWLLIAWQTVVAFGGSVFILTSNRGHPT